VSLSFILSRNEKVEHMRNKITNTLS